MPPQYLLEPTKREIVVVSAKRSSRPTVFGKSAKKVCPFCPGSEHTTPPTTFALPSEKNWRTRSFRNGFPIFKPSGKFKPQKEGELFWSTPGWGDHEVIVETPRHGELFQDLPAQQLSLIFDSYANRFETLSKRKGVKCVFLFKNHGPAGGASIEHEHAQIVALPFVPPLIEKEVDFSEKFWRRNKKCFFCSIKEREKAIVFENEHFVAVRPSFARFSHEFWLLPKRCVESMLEFDVAERNAFMQSLSQSVKCAYNVCPDYNILFHNSPAAGGLHFHCEIIPRKGVWAGLELGTGILVDSKSAKDAAQALKGA